MHSPIHRLIKETTLEHPQLISSSPEHSDAENEPTSYLPIKKGPWTLEEDELLKKHVPFYNEGEWKKVSNHINGRTEIQCRNRWKLLNWENNTFVVDSSDELEIKAEVKEEIAEKSDKTKILEITRYKGDFANPKEKQVQSSPSHRRTEGWSILTTATEKKTIKKKAKNAAKKAAETQKKKHPRINRKYVPTSPIHAFKLSLLEMRMPFLPSPEPVEELPIGKEEKKHLSNNVTIKIGYDLPRFKKYPHLRNIDFLGLYPNDNLEDISPSELQEAEMKRRKAKEKLARIEKEMERRKEAHVGFSQLRSNLFERFDNLVADECDDRSQSQSHRDFNWEMSHFEPNPNFNFPFNFPTQENNFMQENNQIQENYPMQEKSPAQNSTQMQENTPIQEDIPRQERSPIQSNHQLRESPLTGNHQIWRNLSKEEPPDGQSEAQSETKSSLFIKMNSLISRLESSMEHQFQDTDLIKKRDNRRKNNTIQSSGDKRSFVEALQKENEAPSEFSDTESIYKKVKG